MSANLDLPDYFLVDVGKNTSPTESLITGALQTLKENREQYLRSKKTEELLSTIHHLADDWLHPDFPFRKKVQEEGPVKTGYSQEVLMHGLDEFFKSITKESLEFWVAKEFGHQRRLDKVSFTKVEAIQQNASRAISYPLITHFTSGNLPIPALRSMIAGLIVRSAQFLKLSSKSSFVPTMFAHSIYQRAPKLGACIEIVDWSRNQFPNLENLIIDASDIITLTGSDETLANLSERIPHDKIALQYGHKVSFSYICKEALSTYSYVDLAKRLANDITHWDQQGCLSPQVVYVQNLGDISPERFAAQLATELESLQPTRPHSVSNKSLLSQLRLARNFFEIRSQASNDTQIYKSEKDLSWTVIFDTDIRFQSSPGGRLIYVKSVERLEDALHGAEPVQEKVSTVAIAAPEEYENEAAEQFLEWGALRICKIGSMQSPPIHWRHDGVNSLAQLVRWADVEL